ncbi:MAG: hypothetical protein GXY03_07930 [Solirubrobacterales bacterium]|nr:hypothetical protein [Solirubrobacterales bacterium]
MSIRVVHKGSGGTISLVDASRDRSLIMLKSGDAPATVVTPGQRSGGPPGDSDDDRDIWITLGIDPFHVVLDTSDLPGGALVFDERRFLQRAQREGQARGAGATAEVKLTSDSAVEWGLEGGGR